MEKDSMRRLRTIKAEEFARRLREVTEGQDTRYAFFLGAGCSVSSGIPAAGRLVSERWLPRLRNYEAPNIPIDEWQETLEGYDPENPAAFYGPIMERLFHTERDRQIEIESICHGVHPGFAYGILANLVAGQQGRFNVVLTTNFDDMVADALYLYTEARPLVIHHDSLAEYIEVTRTRPLIVKLHGDAHLTPRNTTEETERIAERLNQSVCEVIKERGLIFMGYGGHDEGIRKMLEALPQSAPRQGVYWVSSVEPVGPLRDWLTSRKAVYVEAEDFDMMMVRIRNEFEIKPPSRERFDRIFETYQKTWEELRVRLGELSPDAKRAVEKTDEAFGSWWAVELAARSAGSPDQQDEIYRKGLAKFPDSPELLGNYANFMRSVRGDHDRAQALYERAIEADPKHANNLGNYASFLTRVRGDHDRAQALFERAIEVDPKDAIHLGNYALFLTDVRGDHDRAQALYERAIEADPTNANHLGNYASFLTSVRDDHDRAQTLYERAIEVDPKHAIHPGNYANFIRDVRGDHDRAQALYERAIEADPTNANHLGNYGQFLLRLGRREEGIARVRQALALARPVGPLPIELWFYILAYRIEPEFSTALSEAKKLIQQGARSPGWDLSKDVEIARADGHPDAGWLAKLADVISNGADPQILDAWPAWAEA